MFAAVQSSTPEDMDSDAVFTEQLKTLRHQVVVAEREVTAARLHDESGESASARLVVLIHETRNIAKAWDRVGVVARRTIFDRWVYDVHIVVEPIEGMTRANRRPPW